MDEVCLALVGFLDELIGCEEFGVAHLCLFVHFLYVGDVLIDGLLHGDETVLQISHHIGTVTLGECLVVVSCGDVA